MSAKDKIVSTSKIHALLAGEWIYRMTLQNLPENKKYLDFDEML